MKFKYISIICTSIFLMLILSNFVFAEGDEKPEAESGWLENVPSDFGSLDFKWVIDRAGDESFFDSRYYDIYRNDSLSLDNMDLFLMTKDNLFLDFNASHNWFTRGIESFEFKNPGNWWFFVKNTDTRFFEMPSVGEAKYRNYSISAETGEPGRNNLRIYHNYHKKSDNSNSLTEFNDLWSSSDIGFSYDTDLNDWNVQLGYEKRDMSTDLPELNNVDSSRLSLSVDRELCSNSNIRGTMNYTNSNVQYHDSMSSLALGGAGRFINPLGIDNLILTNRIGWVNRNDDVTFLHPVGDTFNFNIGGRYKPSRNVKIHGSLNYNRSETSYPDDNAIEEAIRTTGDVPLTLGTLTQASIETKRCRFGGSIDLSKYFDFRSDWEFIRRSGLESTEFGTDDSHLIWDKQFRQDYILRYKSGNGSGLDHGNWELKYRDDDRDNDPRKLSDNSQHFTINWSGYLSEDFNLYVGGGYLKTSSKMDTNIQDNQKGREYGGGFDWQMNPRCNGYLNYWNYDVSGNDDFDQVTYLLGLRYKTKDNWSIGLEYENIDDNFTQYADLTGDTQMINLILGYEW
jgi:hypothetical protein